MSRRRDALDTRPGSVPEISRHVGGGLTFVMHPRGLRPAERLVIRCDEAGNVWVAIASEADE